MMDQDREFTGKYEESSRVASMLVDRFYDAVRSLLEPSLSGCASLHEVGCGAGYSTLRLRQWIPEDVEVSASDVTDSLVDKAQARNPDIRVDKRSAYALEFPDKSIDVVVMMEVLEHLDHPDDALAELARVARKYVLISTPREPLWRVLNFARGKYMGDLGNTPGHVNHWSSRGLRKVVSPVFEVEDRRQPVPWTVLRLRPK